MDEIATNNALLMQQIAQLEQERDQLHHDVEQLCKQQSGVSGTTNIMARMQGKRVSSLEQELDGCKQKLAVSMRDNKKLQEELTEVYHIKSQFAELLKEESDKSSQLEKEVKFFQSKVAAAFAERDRMIGEVEKLQSEQEGSMEKMHQLQNSLNEANGDISNKRKEVSILEEELSKLKPQIEAYEQLATKFWQIRDSVERCSTLKIVENKAAILLQDPVEYWRYGDFEKLSQDSHLKVQQAEKSRDLIEEELKVSLSSMSDLQIRLNEECIARSQAEEETLHYKQQFSRFAEIVGTELQRIRAFKNTCVEDISALIGQEKRFVSLISETWQEILSHDGQAIHNSNEQIEERKSEVEEEAHQPRQLKGYDSTSKKDKATDMEESASGESQRLDENREALVQALQEKVAALLLLSQEEERHILESNVTVALECQIRELKEQLSQVTREKVNALMEASRLQEECRRLQDEERELCHMLQNLYGTSANSRLLPAGWAGNTLKEYQSRSIQYQRENKKTTPTGYLKLWLRGFELPGFKPVTYIGSASSSTTKEEDALSTARLRIENATLQESISGLQHLTSSINRLRLKMFQAYSECIRGSEKAPSGSMESMDSVIGEAQRLKVALGGSLPVSYSSSITNIDSIADTEGEIVPEDSKEGGLNGSDVVSFCGSEMISLVLLAAELNKMFISEKLRMPLTC